MTSLNPSDENIASFKDLALRRGRIASFSHDILQKLKAISKEKLEAVKRLIIQSPRIENDLLTEILNYNTAIILDLEKDLRYKLMEERVKKTGRENNFSDVMINKLLNITDDSKLESIFELLRLSPNVIEKALDKQLVKNTEQIKKIIADVKNHLKSKQAGASKRTRRLKKN
jgi:hypothetical protein